MNYALGRAANELIPELQKYKIEVRMVEGIIIWQNTVRTVRPYTPKVVCKRELRRIIKLAKAQEDAKHLEKQGRLL